MARKGLDSTFIHYGIRKEDMRMIETLCVEHELEFDWIEEHILKSFHEKKTSNQDIDTRTVEKILEKALQNLK
jgi:hypothetical protein